MVGIATAGLVMIGTGQPAMSPMPIAAWLVTVFAVDLYIRLQEGVEELLSDDVGGHVWHAPLWALSVAGMLIGIAMYFNWI